MSARDWMVGSAIAALLAAPAATAAVFKCRGADGSLTYQQMPCGDSVESLRSDIATDYPAPNAIERERLLLREAELYQRLEAQRDRLSAEAVARIARPEPVVVAPEPAYAIAWPAGGYGARFAHRRPPMHGWAWGRR